MSYHFSGGDPNEIFKMFFGGEGGCETFFKNSSGPGSDFGNFPFFNMGGGGKSHFSSAFDDEDDFSSFFSSEGGSSFFKQAKQGEKKNKK